MSKGLLRNNPISRPLQSNKRQLNRPNLLRDTWTITVTSACPLGGGGLNLEVPFLDVLVNTFLTRFLMMF